MPEASVEMEMGEGKSGEGKLSIEKSPRVFLAVSFWGSKERE